MVQWWLSTTSCCRKPDGSTGSNWWKRWGRWLWGEMLWKQRSQRDLMRGFHASQILMSSIVCVCVDNMLYALICTPSVQHMTSSYFNPRWRMPKRNPSPSRPVETCWNCGGNSLLRKLHTNVSFTVGAVFVGVLSRPTGIYEKVEGVLFWLMTSPIWSRWCSQQCSNNLKKGMVLVVT